MRCSALPLVLSGLLLGSCSRTTTEATQPDETPDEQRRDDHAQRVEPTPAVLPTHPLEMVPARAVGMVQLRSATRLAEIWGRDQMVGEFPDLYQQVAAQASRVFGHDPLDPAALPLLGIDPSAPIGVALLGIDDEAFVFFGATSDPRALIAMLERRLGTTMTQSTIGNADVYTHDTEFDRWAVVIKNGLFGILFIDRIREGAPDYLGELAGTEPSQSLAHSVAMQRAHAGLPADADLHALLDPAGILEASFESKRRRTQARLREVARQLAEARQRGESPEQIAALQQDVQRLQANLTEEDREEQIIRLVLANTLGSIEGIGAYGNASDKGMTGQIHMALTPDSTLRRLFPAAVPADAAIVATDTTPLMLASAQVDVATALDLVAQLALAEGLSYAQLNDEIRRELRVDFDRDVRPLLDGRSTFVATMGDRYASAYWSSPVQVFSGIWTVGVTDDAKARAVLDRFTAAWPSLPWKPAPSIGGYSLKDDTIGMNWWIGIRNGELAISNDELALLRTQNKEVGKASTVMPDPEAWSWLSSGSAAGRLALDHSVVVRSIFGVRFESFNEFSAHAIRDDVPQTRKIKRLNKQLMKVEMELNTLRENQRTERNRARLAAAGRLGVTIAAARPVDTGLLFEGGHYVKDGGWGYVRSAITVAETDGYVPPTEQMQELEAELNALLQERNQEVERLAIQADKPAR